MPSEIPGPYTVERVVLDIAIRGTQGQMVNLYHEME